jgi:chromosome segregation ATPase
MTPEIVVAIVVAIFGGGGLVALLRLGAERSNIVVTAAQGAVIVQSGVIDDLQDQLADLRAGLAEVRQRAEAAEQRAAAAEARARAAELERDALLRALDDYKDRVTHLEAEVVRLGGHLPPAVQ